MAICPFSRQECVRNECELWITPDEIIAATPQVPKFARGIAETAIQTMRTVLKDGMCSIKYGLAFKMG